METQQNVDASANFNDTSEVPTWEQQRSVEALQSFVAERAFRIGMGDGLKNADDLAELDIQAEFGLAA